MAVKIQSTKDVSAEGAKIVIYGDSGVGKTTLLGHLDSLIIISAEKGLLSLAKRDIPYITVKTLEEVNEAFIYVKKSNYINIGIDTVTEIAEEVLSTFKEAANKKSGKKTDPRPSYNDMADAMGALIRNFRDLDGKNVIFLAKEKPIYEEDSDNIIGYKPMMPGRVLPHGLPYLVDEVFAYQMDKKGKRTIQTATDYKRVAKDRSGNLPLKIESPNLSDIIDLILGG